MSTDGLVDAAAPPMVANEPVSQSLRIPRKPIARGSGSTAPSLSTAETGLPVTTDKTSLAETKQAALNRHERLIRKDASPTPAQKKYVRWGVTWKTPLLIVLWTLAGFGWAVSHHLYYRSLNGTKAGSSSQQHWAVNFGTALAFLVVASLRAACDIVYQQYIWTLFKRKTLSLDALDKLFSVTADPTAFVSWEFIRHAKIAFLVALLCWCMPLAGVTPPATLSVVSGLNNQSRPLSLASLDWQSSGFFNEYGDSAQGPSSDVLQIATVAAQSMTPVSPTPPAINSSFHIQFFGPTVQCSLATGTQEISFDNLTRNLASDLNTIATRSLYESGKIKWGSRGIPVGIAPLMNVYSAFAPNSYGMTETDLSNHLPDTYNNWSPRLKFDPKTKDKDEYVFAEQQLWILTADQGIVCTLGNASFDVRYEFEETALPLIQHSISNFYPLWTPIGQLAEPSYNSTYDNNPRFNSLYSYMAVYMAFASLLNGNVSTSLTNKDTISQANNQGTTTFDGNVTIYHSSSRVLQHGLSACDDFKLGYWSGNGAIGIGQEGPVPWQQAAAETIQNLSSNPISSSLGDKKFTDISNNLFTKPSWMCRNRTLLRAVEDLAHNITISMLSSKKLTKPNATTVPVHFLSTENIYRYDSRNLILSYSIAAFLTFISACIGFFALHYNGVAHSTAFSAIVATTRNHELDAASRGHSLGALPLQHTSMKVRFGEILEEKGGRVSEGDDEGVERRSGRHIGFGAADKVVRLRKGGKYV